MTGGKTILVPLLMFILAVAMMILSFMLRKKYKNTKLEGVFKVFVPGFFLVAFTIFIVLITQTLIVKGVMPKTFMWVTKLYEIFGLVGIILVVYGLYIVKNKDIR